MSSEHKEMLRSTINSIRNCHGGSMPVLSTRADGGSMYAMASWWFYSSIKPVNAIGTLCSRMKPSLHAACNP